jgi:hypothetical protein
MAYDDDAYSSDDNDWLDDDLNEVADGDTLVAQQDSSELADGFDAAVTVELDELPTSNTDVSDDDPEAPGFFRDDDPVFFSTQDVTASTAESDDTSTVDESRLTGTLAPERDTAGPTDSNESTADAPDSVTESRLTGTLAPEGNGPDTSGADADDTVAHGLTLVNFYGIDADPA